MAKKEANSPAPEPKRVKVLFNAVSQKGQSRTAKEASVWLYSPGNVFPLMEGERAIRSIGIEGQPINQLDYIRAAWAEGSTVIYLFPTDKTDPDAVEVKRSKGRVNANLSDYLLGWKIALPVNTKSRFRLQFTTEADPVHPAVKLDTAAPIETRPINRKRNKSKTQTPAQTQTPADAAAPAENTAAGQNAPASQKTEPQG